MQKEMKSIRLGLSLLGSIALVILSPNSIALVIFSLDSTILGFKFLLKAKESRFFLCFVLLSLCLSSSFFMVNFSRARCMGFICSTKFFRDPYAKLRSYQGSLCCWLGWIRRHHWAYVCYEEYWKYPSLDSNDIDKFSYIFFLHPWISKFCVTRCWWYEFLITKYLDNEWFIIVSVVC